MEVVRVLTALTGFLAFFMSGIAFAIENPDEDYLRRVRKLLFPILMVAVVICVIATAAWWALYFIGWLLA